MASLWTRGFLLWLHLKMCWPKHPAACEKTSGTQGNNTTCDLPYKLFHMLFHKLSYHILSYWGLTGQLLANFSTVPGNHLRSRVNSAQFLLVSKVANVGFTYGYHSYCYKLWLLIEAFHSELNLHLSTDWMFHGILHHCLCHYWNHVHLLLCCSRAIFPYHALPEIS